MQVQRALPCRYASEGARILPEAAQVLCPERPQAQTSQGTEEEVGWGVHTMCVSVRILFCLVKEFCDVGWAWGDAQTWFLKFVQTVILPWRRGYEVQLLCCVFSGREK